ncbi:T9SS type A sorting domain-containing protein [Dyadobacter sp. 3J3]|uniref:T9SS type A sorting domain-containing protein n=1 Tax=Dyadobacter sp. 3J3 TaxID=2606600 RepID=UPI00135C7056|nr:T9SS type A sorting domain-containing protein [Dyadobacter sp. 3J3]
MKTPTLFLSAAFSLLLSVNSFAGIAKSTDSAIEAENQIAITSPVSGKIDVMIKKSDGKNRSIRVVDENGNTLVSITVKNYEDTRTRFDLNNLTDGDYQVMVTDGTTTVVKPITLDTHDYRTVKMG